MELLVVIAIIAILAALGFPALQKMSEQASFSKCAANLRTLGVGVLRYAADNNGGLPHNSQEVNGDKLTWAEVALGKRPKQAEARRLCCPSMPEPGLDIWGMFSSGYGYNPNLGTYAGYFTMQIKDGNSYPNVRLASIRRPSQVIMATDTGQDRTEASHLMFDLWGPYTCMRTRDGVWQLVPNRVNPARAEQPVDPKYFRDGDPAGLEHRLPAWPFNDSSGKTRPARHGGKINALFIDGHIEALRPEDIKEKNIYWSY